MQMKIKPGMGVAFFGMLSLLGGCAESVAPEDHPTTTYTINDPKELGGMERVVQYREQAADGHSYHLAEALHLGRVDYNSRVEIDPSAEALRALVDKTVKQTALTDNDKKRLQAYVGVAKQYHDLLQTLAGKTGVNPITPPAGANLRASIVALNTVVSNDSVESFQPIDADGILSAGDTKIDVDKLKQAFQAEKDSLKRLVRQRMAKVAGNYGVSVQAFIAGTKNPTPVHVQNYDDLTDVGAPKQPIYNSSGATSVPFPDVVAAATDNALSVPAEASLDFSTPVSTLDDVKPGFIDLSATSVDRGSIVKIYTTLFKVPDSTQVSPPVPGAAGAAPGTATNSPNSSTNNSAEEVDQTSRDFSVDRLGLSYTVSANAIFVNQFGRGQSVVGLVPNYKRPGFHKGLVEGPASHNFLPAAGATLTLHYRPRWADDSNWGSRIYDALDPGLGLNIAALNATDLNSSTHLGLGLGVQGRSFTTSFRSGMAMI